jgi:hypothetical protein
VEHPIRQAAHLGVGALASVLARGAWQRDYLLQGQQHRSTQYALTRAAAGTLATEGVQLTHLTDRADKVIRSG